MNIFCTSFLLATLCIGLNYGSHFTLIGPRTVHYKSTYKCVLSTTYNKKDNVAVQVKMIGKSGTEVFEESYLLDKTWKNNTIDIDLSIEDHLENYTISLYSEKAKVNESVDVYVIPKKYSVLIQTDKPVYKPGDMIHYRILILNADLKPYNVSEDQITHEIYDGDGNVLPNAKKEDSTDGDQDNDSDGSTQYDDNETEIDPGVFGNDPPANPYTSKNSKSGQEDDQGLIDEAKGEITAGLFAYQFQLNEETSEGLWSINVTVNEKFNFSTIQTFVVKKYILPRFQVFVEAKPHVRKDEGDIRLNVFANYTFGKFVSGKAKVTCRVYDLENPSIAQRIVKKTIEGIETKKTISFDIGRDLEIVKVVRPFDATFEVEFEEKLTGQKLKETKTVRIDDNSPFVVNIVREYKRFKPGFDYKFDVIVDNLDGNPAPQSIENVDITVTYDYYPILCTPKSEINSLIKNFDQSQKKRLIGGKAQFTLNVPSNTTVFTITAKYYENEVSVKVPQYKASTREYMTIKHKPKMVKKVAKRPTVGEPIQFELKFSDKAGTNPIFCVVIGRTGVVFEKKYTSAIKDEKTIIAFKAQKNMMPSSRVIVYYFQGNGEIIFDQTLMEIPTTAMTTMGLLFHNETMTKMPGQKCQLYAQAQKGSFVSLLGVDQSVTLLGSGNDITRSRVSAEMKLFEDSTYTEVTENTNSKYPGFTEANAFIITNAHDGVKNCSLVEKLGGELFKDNFLPEFDDFDLDDVPKGTEVRKNFPETWIFKDFKMGDDGKIFIDTVVPDTISSFVVSGFAVHPEHGLAIAKPRKITVFKEFFVKIFVPYSIKLGEVMKVEVTVYNYLSKKENIKVEITMYGQEEFEFVEDPKGTCSFTALVNQDKSVKSVNSVLQDKGASTSFLIRAKTVGMIKIKIRATTKDLEDNIERFVKVERLGLRKIETKSVFIDNRNKTLHSYSFSIAMPESGYFIADSVVISASAVGNYFGPAIANIEKLLEMPDGCNEQKFKRFIPNIVAMDYLKAVGKLRKTFQNDGVKYLESGYQEVLKTRKDDGSFSFWGETTEGSVWLTAYVAKMLSHAKRWTSVDDQLIFAALTFVKSYQLPSGGFNDSSSHYYDIDKTSAQKGLALNAFIAISFLENVDHSKTFNETIQNLMVFLKSANRTDNHSTSMMAYAFALHKDTDFVTLLIDDLFDEALVSEKEDGKKMSWQHKNPAMMVETASYMIMALIKTGRLLEASPIFNWLKTQQQASGGFHTTTDTVIGIQAIAMYATELHTPNENLDITLSYERGRKVNFAFRPQNTMVLHVKGVAQDARNFGLNANGTGVASFQLVHSYSLVLNNSGTFFDLKVRPIPTGDVNIMHLNISAKYIEKEDKKETSMAIIEVNLPSGYEYDETSRRLATQAGVKKIELNHQKTVVILYFDRIDTKGVQPEIKAIRKNIVEALKSSTVKVYDYYGPNEWALAFYSIEKNCEL